MISDQELRRRLDEIREELDRALEGASEPQVRQSIGRAEAIVEELRSTVSKPGKKRYCIMDLEGVGKEFWSKIDVEEYIRKERESWR